MLKMFSDKRKKNKDKNLDLGVKSTGNGKYMGRYKIFFHITNFFKR